MEQKKPHYLVVCLVIRDENQYLAEFIEENLRSGVEHFFIYDNESSTPVQEFLDGRPALAKHCTVERFLSTDRTQLDCYMKFVQDHREDTVWAAFIDADEHFEGDLHALCKTNERYLSLSFRQVMHGAAGQAYYDKSKTLRQRFYNHVTTKFFYRKVVVQLDHLLWQNPHHPYIDAPGIPKSRWLKFIDSGAVRCHHYFYRSFEEWCMKIKRGNVLSFAGDCVNKFFEENEIAEQDKQAILKEYGLELTTRSQGGITRTHIP